LGTTVSIIPQAFDRGNMQVIKLPTSALRQDGKTSAVWVLDTQSMTVKLQPVQIATADGNEVVISAGLQPGMQVVSAGVHVLSPGQKVTVYVKKVALAPVSVDSDATISIANMTPAATMATPAPAVAAQPSASPAK